jgi:hypothetical protein
MGGIRPSVILRTPNDGAWFQIFRSNASIRPRTRRLPTDLCNALWIEDRRMFERMLEPGCTESPACQCGGEMQVVTIETLQHGTDAAVRIS